MTDINKHLVIGSCTAALSAALHVKRYPRTSREVVGPAHNDLGLQSACCRSLCVPACCDANTKEVVQCKLQLAHMAT
jgi:hypothetical protein